MEEKDIIQYELKGEKPKIYELIDDTKTLQLISEIKKSNVSNEKKDFLIKSAYRFMNFNYSKIAEYYANQDYEMQELMEKLGLVIIDYDNAIKKGYEDLIKKIEGMSNGEK